MPTQYNLLRCLGTAILIALLLGTGFGAALVYQYDNLLWFGSSNYAAQTFAIPGGGAEYLAAVWAEPYSAAWVGALFTGLLLALGGTGIRFVAHGSADRWSLGYVGPWIIAAGVFDPQFLVDIWAWFLALGAIALWARGAKARAELAGLVVVVAYGLGGAMAMVLATGVVLTRLLVDRRAVLWVVATAAIAGLTPLAGAYLYGISIPAAYEVGASLSWWVVGFSILATAIGNRTLGRKERKAYWSWVALGVVSVGGAIGLLSQHNAQLEAMMRIEQASDRGQWAEVVERTNAFEQRHGSSRMVTFWRNTALWRQGKLLAQLFDVPQPYGPMGLCYDWNEEQGAKAIVGAKLSAEGYRNAGLLWQAHRLTYEAMAGHRPTHYTLSHLEAYNRALGRHKAADRYERLLGHSLREKYSVSLPQPAVGSDSVSSRSGNLIADLEQVVASDTTHHEALAYLTAVYLSAGHTQGIAGLAHRWSALPAGQRIPEIVQQALLAAGHHFAADLHIAQRFQRFIGQLQHGQGNPQAISADLHNTYWFYTLCLAQQRKQK